MGWSTPSADTEVWNDEEGSYVLLNLSVSSFWCKYGISSMKDNIYPRHIVSCPDRTHSHEEKGLVDFEQFLGLSSEFWEANQNRSM